MESAIHFRGATPFPLSKTTRISTPQRAEASASTTQAMRRAISGSPWEHHSQFSKPVSRFSVSWWRRDDLSKMLISGVVPIFVYWLSVASGAQDASAASYPCENVSQYYSGLGGAEGVSLMQKLNKIVSGHKSLPYKKVWDALKVLDAADVDHPEASTSIVEIYSLRVVPKVSAAKPEGWNREHLWPRSYGLTDGPSLTDLHNIRPADVNVNSSRGNKYYGECSSYASNCLKPANREAASDTETDKERWAPPHQVRGDVARSLLYMAVRYGFPQPNEGPQLRLSDSPNIKKREMGLLSTLLKWNERDPPSKAEKLRNDRICKFYQHNRNPFVDHPEYAYLIWKHATFNDSCMNCSSLRARMNEFHYNNKGKDKNEFVEFFVQSQTDSNSLQLVLYNGGSGKMYKSLSLGDPRAYNITDIGTRILIYTSFLPLQNGPGDGIALILNREGNNHEVFQFISYGGTLQPVDGPAEGMLSLDIKIGGTDNSSECDSVGLSEGQNGMYEWRIFPGEASPGMLNRGQSLQNIQGTFFKY